MGFLHWRCQAFVYFSFSTFLFLGLVRSGFAGMEKVFEKRFAGIDLKPVPGRGSKSIGRISDEFKAGVRYFDVHVGGSSSLFTGLIKPGIVDPIEAYMVL